MLETIAQRPRRIETAAAELFTVLRHWEQWWVLAWADTKFRYRRTTLGPIWITLSLAATVFSVGILYGTILGNGNLPDYLPYFAIGMIVWTYVSMSMIDGCTVFIKATSIIKAMPVPPVLHVYRMMAGELVVLAHNALLVVVLWLLFQWPIGWVTLLAIPGIALDTIALLGAILTFSIVCTRFRDFQQIISNVLQLIFFVTPIIWTPASLKGATMHFVIRLNPFYYFIEVVRQPLLGVAPDVVTWIIVGSLALVLLALGTTFYVRLRHRVAFWI